MKKYITSPKMVKYFIISFSIPIVFFALIMGISANLDIGTIFIFVAMYSVLVIVGLKQERNAFLKFWIDDEGIHNRYTTLKWEEIEEYELFEVAYYRNYTTKFQCPSVICFGKFNKNKPFLKQNPKECVFVSILPKHFDLLDQYRGKSKVVDEVIDLYRR